MTIDIAPPLARPAALSLNRFLSMNLIHEHGDVIGLEVSAPVRGEGLRVTRVDARTQREDFDWLMSLRDAPRAPSLTIPADVVDRLRGAGVLMPRGEVPRGVRYGCFIDAQGRMPDAAPLTRPPWIVNPSLKVLPGTGSFSAPGGAAALAEAEALAWLCLPGSDVAFAYWLDASDREQLARLASHRLVPQNLKPPTRTRFARAGLLTTFDAVVRGRRCLQRRIRARREHLAREGWVRLPGLLPRPLRDSLQAYVAPLIGEGHLRFNDTQSRRYFQHGEPMSVWLHQQLEPALQALVDEPIKRSYAFLGGYVAGSDLKPHTDRAQCEYTLSLTLDAAPDHGRRGAWPLGLIDRHGRERWVRLAPGDALLFKGCELPHFRRPLPEGCRSTSAFLHFVRADFAGSLD